MKRIGKLLISISAFATFAGSSQARNQLEDFEDYRSFLETKHVKGDAQLAQNQLSRLVDRLPSGDFLKAHIVTHDLAENTATPDPDELAYATGRKKEYYCKGKGLVLAEGEHSDGNWSKLVLLSSVRRMDSDQYAIVQDGSQWIYELSNSFRQPAQSEVWQTYGRENAFNIMEVRRLDHGKVDQGSWDYQWSDGGFRSRHSVTGEHLEPVRNLFMATQYHLWGSVHLGYDLKFEVGYKDINKWRANGDKSGNFPVLSEREVAKHYPELTVTDSTGADHIHSDCYRVDMTLTYDPDQEKPEKL